MLGHLRRPLPRCECSRTRSLQRGKEVIFHVSTSPVVELVLVVYRAFFILVLRMTHDFLDGNMLLKGYVCISQRCNPNEANKVTERCASYDKQHCWGPANNPGVGAEGWFNNFRMACRAAWDGRYGQPCTDLTLFKFTWCILCETSIAGSTGERRDLFIL